MVAGDHDTSNEIATHMTVARLHHPTFPHGGGLGPSFSSCTVMQFYEYASTTHLRLQNLRMVVENPVYANPHGGLSP